MIEEDQTIRLLNSRCCSVRRELCHRLSGTIDGEEAWLYLEVKRCLHSGFLQRKGKSFQTKRYGEILISGKGNNPSESDVAKVRQIFQDREIKGDKGADATPLHLAIVNNKAELVEQFLQLGADPNIKDCFGTDSLSLAASTGDIGLVRLLLKSDKIPCSFEVFRSALIVAELNEYEHVASEIRSYMNSLPSDLIGPSTPARELILGN